MKDIDVVVDRGLRIDGRQLGKRERAALTRRFKYPNPTRQQLQRMGRFYRNQPMYIVHYEETEDGQLILPRGATEKLEAWAEEVERRLWWIDERWTVEPVEFVIGPNAVPIQLREDQLRLVDVAYRRENALIRAATGSGKTEITLELIRRIGQPTLVIVWNNGLMKQWIDRICLRWGWSRNEVGMFGDGQKRIRPLTIAMQQSLCRPGVSESLAEHFGFVVVDEVQRASSRTLREVVRSFPARWRLGVSADERRKDRMDVLIGDNFGAVAAEVRREELIARGDLCEVEFHLVPSGTRSPTLDQAPTADWSTIKQQQYTRIIGEITADEVRTRMIADLAAREIEAGESVLIFTDRVTHARAISKRIVELGHRCGLMIGGSENRQNFDDSAGRIQAGTLKCAVGTSAVYQGIDIPRLSRGIVATPTATNVKLLEQQAGRLRRKFPGKRFGRLYYVWDEIIFPSHRELIERAYGRDLVRVVD